MSSASTTPSLKATDLLAVKSRVSWGAIAAGAMVSLAVYFLLTLVAIAVGLEVASRRGPDQGFGAGAAIASIVTLLLSMFLGGWATSRLAVGETKLEAVLYGVILWGVLFLGILWMVGNGIRVGFSALVSGAVVVNADDPSAAASDGAFNALVSRYGSEVGGQKFVDDLTKMGVDAEQAKKVEATLRDRLNTLKNDPANLPGKLGADLNSDEAREAGNQAVGISKRAAWYTLAGVAISMAAVVFGSLIGSGDLPVPVPILGVRRAPVDPRM